MRRRLQFAGWLVALGMSLALAAPSFAQAQRGNGAQNRQANRPPARQSQPPRQQTPRQQQRRDSRQPQQAPKAQNGRQNSGGNSGGNRPPNAAANRADVIGQPNINPNRPLSAYTPPPQKKLNQLSPQEQRKVIENYNKQRNLAPAQRQEINKRIENWNKLTPEQKSHVRSDLAPKWNQMPKQRQDAIQHRLEILQNMPESARNQHLNDPNFTRGMNEEDKTMLRDLSHMHMGAPDPPKE